MAENQETFDQNKKFITELFKTVADKSFSYIQDYFELLKVRVSKKLDAVTKQYSSVESLLSQCREGKHKTVLHFAAARGDLDIFKYLIELGAKLDEEDNDKNTSFFTAVQHQHLNIITYIVEELQYDIEIKRNNDLNAVHLTSMVHNIPQLEYLLNKKPHLIESTSQFGTPLQWACATPHQKQFDTVKFLLQNGANPNGQENCQVPGPLHLAIDFNSQPIFDILLEYKANVNAIDQQQLSALQVSVEKENLDMQHNFKKLEFFTFFKIILQMVMKLVEKGANLNYNQGSHGKPEEIAMELGQIEIWRYIRKYQGLGLEGEHQVQQKQQEQKQKELDEQQRKEPEYDQSESISNEFKQQGNKLFGEGKFEESLIFYEKALNHQKNSVALYTNKAAALLKLNRFKETLEVCKQAKLIKEDWVKTHFRESEAYIGLKDHAEAAASLFDCIKLEPDNKLFKKMFNEQKVLAKQQYQQQNNK